MDNHIVKSECRSWSVIGDDVNIPIPVFYKVASERLDYSIDWTNWLNPGDSLVSSSWVVPTGLTKSTDEVNGNSSYVVVTGGVAGTTYTLSCTVNTVLGLISIRSINLTIVSAR